MLVRHYNLHNWPWYLLLVECLHCDHHMESMSVWSRCLIFYQTPAFTIKLCPCQLLNRFLLSHSQLSGNIKRFPKKPFLVYRFCCCLWCDGGPLLETYLSDNPVFCLLLLKKWMTIFAHTSVNSKIIFDEYVVCQSVRYASEHSLKSLDRSVWMQWRGGREKRLLKPAVGRAKGVLNPIRPCTC